MKSERASSAEGGSAYGGGLISASASERGMGGMSESASESFPPFRIEDREALERISPTIVRITGATDDRTWYGSGVIVDPVDIIPEYIPLFGEYFILTNWHVADDTKYLSAKFVNGIETFLDIVESPYSTPMIDFGTEVALLRVWIPADVPTAPIGRTAEIGEIVYTAGHPQALPEHSFSKGIISQTEQEIGFWTKVLHSDAPINPGNSGGPLLNTGGEILGLNTFILQEGEDLSFTVPINVQIEALRTIWRSEEIIRGALKFKVGPLSLIDRKRMDIPEDITGAIVTEVKPRSMAERSGLKVGDIITGIEAFEGDEAIDSLDVDIKDNYEAEGVIKRWAAKLTPGAEVVLTIFKQDSKGYTTEEIITEAEMLTEEDND